MASFAGLVSSTSSSSASALPSAQVFLWSLEPSPETLVLVSFDHFSVYIKIRTVDHVDDKVSVLCISLNLSFFSLTIKCFLEDIEFDSYAVFVYFSIHIVQLVFLFPGFFDQV